MINSLKFMLKKRKLRINMLPRHRGDLPKYKASKDLITMISPCKIGKVNRSTLERSLMVFLIHQ